MTPLKKPAMRYHGAKFRLAPWVISHFPAHRCYVESFGGSAGVLLSKERSYAEVYNDLDDDICNYFQVLRDPQLSQRLSELCRLTPYSRQEFVKAYMQEAIECPVERARRTIVRATMSFSSAGATYGDTGFRTDTKRPYGNPLHVWDKYPENIPTIHERLRKVLIENRPALQVMQSHDAPDTLHYVDPPYMPQTRTRLGSMRFYRHELTIQDHELLLEGLKHLEGMVIVSGYESELYNDTLTGWHLIKKQVAASGNAGSKLRTECLWINPAAVAAKEKEAEKCAA